jgi:RNA polymerase sigma-70 factor (ECF subfamily)
MQSDLALVDRAVAAVKEGDASALHYLYVRYADDVLACTRRVVWNRQDAEDVTQNVFMKLPDKLRHYESRGVPFEHWLLRVARNAALDHLRSRRPVPCAEVYATEEGYEDGSLETRDVLRDVLALLPPDQREVVFWRHVAGLSPGEIGGRLGRSEAAVHGLHHRGRRALRGALDESGARPKVAASVG